MRNKNILICQTMLSSFFCHVVPLICVKSGGHVVVIIKTKTGNRNIIIYIWYILSLIVEVDILLCLSDNIISTFLMFFIFNQYLSLLAYAPLFYFFSHLE